MIQLITAQRYAAGKLTEGYKVLHASKGLEVKPLFEDEDGAETEHLESQAEEAKEVASESSKKAKRLPHSSFSGSKSR